jgi:YgiT-type zinc finger domain-containing protein
MTCVICKHGELEPGTHTLTLERGTTVLVVRGVPARVCDSCGEAYVDGNAVTAALEQLATAAANGVQVEVREYAA